MEREYVNNLNSLITSENEITPQMNGKKYFFKCESCGVISEKGIYWKKGKLEYFSLVCTKCNRKKTNLEKYGCENPFQSNEIKNKIRKTNIEKYGVENINSLSEIREKIENTRKLKYGEHKELIVEKAKQTFLERFGVDNPQKCNEVREKTKKTNLEKYGNEVAFSYGSDEFKEYMKNKYGVEHALQNRDLRLKAQKRYFYQNIYFDSSWELAYYIWLKDSNIDFTFQPFENLYYNGHHYTPDFKVNGELQEIKGNQFFKEGKLFNPYTKTFCTEYEEMLKIFNVKIIKQEDLIEPLNYVYTNYGKDFLQNCKRY